MVKDPLPAGKERQHFSDLGEKQRNFKETRSSESRGRIRKAGRMEEQVAVHAWPQMRPQMRPAIRDDGKWLVKRAIARGSSRAATANDPRCRCDATQPRDVSATVNRHPFASATRRALCLMRSRVQIILTKWSTSAIYCQTVLASSAWPY